MKKEPMREYKPHIKTSQSKNRLSCKLSQKLPQNEDGLVDGTQETGIFSFIKDPLWRHIYCEALRTIGPTAEQIWQVQLGPLSHIDTTLDLYCYTSEIAQILQQYNFIILDNLRQYFPAIKELRIKLIINKE